MHAIVTTIKQGTRFYLTPKGYASDIPERAERAEAHAGKLAEALRHLLAISHNSNANQYKEARKALAAYEEARQ